MSRPREVDWSAGAVELLTRARPWPDTGQPRRAAVSAFGVSGTNAHVILEQAPAPAEAAGQPRARPAAGRGALGGLRQVRRRPAAQAARLARFALDHPDVTAADIGLSLAAGRAELEHRAVVVADGRAGLVDGLHALASGDRPRCLVSGVASDEEAPVVFVFPGQGWQWVGMARGLLDASPAFAARMGECAAVLDPLLGWSLLDKLRAVPGGDGAGGEPASGGAASGGAASGEAVWGEAADVVQPVMFAVLVSLAEVWRAAGVVPAAVVGHSQGEIAAACVAGRLSLADAARVVVARSRVIAGRLSGRGGMVSVPLPAARVRDWVAGLPGVDVAAVNGPAATVVSGDPGGLAGLLARCAAEGVQARRIDVDYASHCAQVDVVEEELAAALAGIGAAAGQVPFASSVTGGWLDGGELDAAYWMRNLRQPVRFADAVTTLLQAGYSAFVEVSAHPVLAGAVADIAADLGMAAGAFGTLRRGEGDLTRLYLSLGAAWSAGIAVDWTASFAGSGARRADLPTYAFQRDSYWLAPGAAGSAPAARPLARKHASGPPSSRRTPRPSRSCWARSKPGTRTGRGDACAIVLAADQPRPVRGRLLALPDRLAAGDRGRGGCPARPLAAAHPPGAVPGPGHRPVCCCPGQRRPDRRAGRAGPGPMAGRRQPRRSWTRAASSPASCHCWDFRTARSPAIPRSRRPWPPP